MSCQLKQTLVTKIKKLKCRNECEEQVIRSCDSHYYIVTCTILLIIISLLYDLMSHMSGAMANSFQATDILVKSWLS